MAHPLPPPPPLSGPATKKRFFLRLPLVTLRTKCSCLQKLYIYKTICNIWRVRRVSGLRREPVVSVENPILIPTSHWKRWSLPSRGRLRPSRCKFCAGVLCTELATRWSKFSTKTANFLRNSGVRRSLSCVLYVHCTVVTKMNLHRLTINAHLFDLTYCDYRHNIYL